MLDRKAMSERSIARQTLAETVIREVMQIARENADQCSEQSSDKWLAEFGFGFLSTLTLFGQTTPKVVLYGSKEASTQTAIKAFLGEIKEFAPEQPEHDVIILTVGNYLLGMATGSITTGLGMWESRTFQRETAPAT